MIFLKKYSIEEKVVFFILVSLYMVFLIFRLLSGISHLADSYEYLETAANIKNLLLFNPETNASLETKRPFVYPLFLTFLLKMPVPLILFIQTLVGIYTIYLLLNIIKKFGVQIRANVLWFFIFTPSIFIYTQLIMAEWLALFFMTLLFWLLMKDWNRRNFAWIQIITILLAFTKPAFYPLIYVNLIFWTVYLVKRRTFSFWLLIPLIVVQSYMSFNEVKTGYRHFSSIANTNLINYNLYYFKSKTESKESADRWKEKVYQAKPGEMNFKEKNEYFHSVAANEIKQHFFQYSFYHFTTAIRGIFDPGRFDLMTFFRKENGRQGFLEIINSEKSVTDLLKNKFAYVYVLLVPIFLILLVKWIFFFRYLLVLKPNPGIYYLVIMLLSYILINGPVHCSRYMVPFQGIIIAFAVLGMNTKQIQKS